MCGIFGVYGERWQAGFVEALDTLATRGPDACGTWRDGAMQLGHRRLAILDTSDAGRQPMATDDGRFHIVFNGEIYNYPALKRELESAGVAFRSRCDTEALLHAMARWGRDALPRLDGMFAFAVWDAQARKLFAVRDRFGIKPFYYSAPGGLTGGATGGFVFASTLRPFFALEGFPRKLDNEALRDYLATQSIPAPRTILRDVRALPPASWLTFDAETGRVETGRYWEIADARDAPMAYEELVERTDDALRESVRRQMLSDVPLGAFLSGGIDSSLLVSYMAEESSSAVKTFCVGFGGHGRFDESAHARVVAERFGCEHHEFEAKEMDAERLGEALQGLDQPFADAAFLPTLGLSELTRQHVTVAISGDGGDELFGGYPRFLEDETSRADSPWRAALRGLIRARMLPASLIGKSLRGRQRLLWDRVKLGPWPRSRKDMTRFLSPDAVAAAHIDGTMQGWLSLLDRFGPVADTDALMRADLWTYLSDDCLMKTDRASMAHSLEVRVPMLGNDVVDLVLPQPASVKMHRGLKSILKTLAERRLPRQVWDRPKHGFSVPVRDYFRGPWRDRCAAWIDGAADVAPFLNAAAVRKQWEQTLNGRAERRVTYTLIALLAWLEKWPVEG